MKCEKSRTLYRCIKLIDDGQEIPFALRNLANQYGINLEHLKEVVADVNKEEPKFINSESSETGVPYSEDEYFNYPEAYT